MIVTAGNIRTEIKPMQVPLCPPQVSHGLSHNRTRASAVQGVFCHEFYLSKVYKISPTSRKTLCLPILDQTVEFTCGYNTLLTARIKLNT